MGQNSGVGDRIAGSDGCSIVERQRQGVLRPSSVLLIIALATLLPNTASAFQTDGGAMPREVRIPVGNTSLFVRTVGAGPPVIVLHGGPDFDHRYLLPDLDRLADSLRLIYFDQRGRGQSADGVQPEDVTLGSDLDDIDRVRHYFQLDAPILLGHSWGAVLALEYALRHPTRVSRLILMNPAPVSASDLAEFRKAYLAGLGADMERQRAIVSSAAYQAGEPEAVVSRYRIHFRPAFRHASHFERLMSAMRDAFVSQGSSGIIKARAVEDRLMRETWQAPGYDLVPSLRRLHVPTLVITGAHDFIPVFVSEHISQALPDARLVVLESCGHFAYMECPDESRAALRAFLPRPR